MKQLSAPGVQCRNGPRELAAGCGADSQADTSQDRSTDVGLVYCALSLVPASLQGTVLDVTFVKRWLCALDMG